jgi:hypothetical protein
MLSVSDLQRISSSTPTKFVSHGFFLHERLIRTKKKGNQYQGGHPPRGISFFLKKQQKDEKGSFSFEAKTSSQKLLFFARHSKLVAPLSLKKRSWFSLKDGRLHVMQ